MKKLLCIALLAISLPSFAGTVPCDTCKVITDTMQFARTIDGQAQGQAQSASSDSAATNQGNNQNITFTSPGSTTSKTELSGTQTIKNVPSVSGPPLTTSNDTCMGSTSGSLNFAGLGLGGGSTWVDNNCKRLKNARELWNMGMKGAGMALMCKDPENREALESTGYVCPVPPEKKKSGATSGSSEPASKTSSAASLLLTGSN